MTAGHAGDDAGVQAVVLAGLRAGKPMREIAVELYGAHLVAAEWPDYNGWMRARMRRLARRARAASVRESGAAARGTP